MPNTGLARARRKKPTWAEKLMWRWLRDRRFTGYKFRREHPAGDYLLDFFCEEARLSIELDGFQHGHPARQAYDTERTRFLKTLGIKELRFWNWRLRREGQAVRDAIFNALQQRAPHPLPAYIRPGIVGAEKSQKDARPQDVMDPGKNQRHARPHPGPPSPSPIGWERVAEGRVRARERVWERGSFRAVLKGSSASQKRGERFSLSWGRGLG